MKKENIVYLPVVTRIDLPADRILEQAIGQLESVFIAGFDKDGNEYFKTSYADAADALWILERAKAALLNVVSDMTGE